MLRSLTGKAEAAMNHDYFRAALLVGLAPWQICAFAAEPSAPKALVEQLFDKELAGAADKEVLMLTVEYPPGVASLPHRHDAQVFVYVLEGEVKMQVAGSPEVTLRRGQTFYESPADVHTVSANAGTTAPAKILVFIVKDKHTPASREIAPQGKP
jgi:quercetin dioxygenase-like cupin family protein